MSSPTQSSREGAIPCRPARRGPTPAPAGPGSTTRIAPSPGSRSSPGRSRSWASRRSTSRTSARSTTSTSAPTRSRTARSPGRARFRATTASRPARRRCRRAGRTIPIRTPTSTRRGASTRRRCRSTPSGAAASTRTARSTSPTPTTSACTGRRATAAPISSRTTTRRASASATWRTSSGSRSTTSRAAEYQDHVYAMWTTFNGASGNGKIRLAVSRDRGQTFAKPVTITPPGTTTPATTYVLPSVGVDGTLYVAFVGGFDTKNKNRVGHVYVTKSIDDGVTFGPFVEAASPGENPNGFLPNTNFRDGIIESFAASPTYAGHLYLTYEDWDFAAGQFDVKFKQSTDGGLTWSSEQTVNDAAELGDNRPVPAIGRRGARRRGRGRVLRPAGELPGRPEHPAPAPRRREHLHRHLAAGLQGQRDAAGAVPVGSNVRVSQFTWDPDQPQQKVGGVTQYAVRRPQRPLPGRSRLHRRLLRARDLGREHLHARRLDPLPVSDGDRRRRRACLLPEPGARNRAPFNLRGRVLELRTPGGARLPGPLPAPQTHRRVHHRQRLLAQGDHRLRRCAELPAGVCDPGARRVSRPVPEDHEGRVLRRFRRPVVPRRDLVALNTWTFSARCDGPNLEYRVDSAPAQAFLDANL